MTPHPATLLSLLIAAADPVSCPPLPELGTLVCREGVAGIIYGRDAEEVRRLAEDEQAAAAAYRMHFGRPPPRGALVSAGSATPVGEAVRGRLRAAGLTWVLPWIDAADRQRALEPKIRAQVERQLAGAPAAAIDAAVARALAAAGSAGPDGDTTLRSAVRHELGHLWLIEDHWPRRPDAAAPTAAHYGGPAPDWLDETAAVLMEDAAMADGRRARFAQIRRGEASDETPIPLARFVTMDHPLAARVRAERPAGTGSTVTVVSGEAARRLAGGASAFYAQARVFADFLIAASGRPDVFAAIAAATAGGEDLGAWLAREGDRYGLPSTLDALDRAWQAWLDTPAAAPPRS